MTQFDFGSMLSQENQVKQIPVDILVPFHNHQFTLYEGERKDDMVESIKNNGVMTPIICRPNPNNSGTYEILIGHNRWNCSKIAGLDSIPGIIKENLSEDEAQTYVDESNLLQRGFSDLKASEQARIIARRYSEMFSQGKRNDIINEIRILNGESVSSSSEEKLGNSREKLGEEYGLSRNTIARLVRISKLCDGILSWIDNKQISIRAGVEISYLSLESQDLLFRLNSDNNNGNILLKISEGQAKDLRMLYNDCKKAGEEFDRKMIMRVLIKERKKPDKKVSINTELYSKYFKDKDNDEIQKILELALQQYFNF